jgi:hypothetical protein
LLAVGDAADDFALARIYDQLYGFGIWLPASWWAPQAEGGPLAFVALRSFVTHKVLRGDPVIVTTSSDDHSLLEQVLGDLRSPMVWAEGGEEEMAEKYEKAIAIGPPGWTLEGAWRLMVEGRSAQYLLVQDAIGVRSTWTFTSSAPSRNTIEPNFACASIASGWPGNCQPEPMVFLGYDLGPRLRLDNTVPAGLPHLFEVTAYHNSHATRRMPEIAGLRLWTSTDGGKH